MFGLKGVSAQVSKKYLEKLQHPVLHPENKTASIKEERGMKSKFEAK